MELVTCDTCSEEDEIEYSTTPTFLILEASDTGFPRILIGKGGGVI